AMAMGLGASDGASLWRALTRKPERSQAQPAFAGVPALPSAPVAAGAGILDGFMRLIGKKPQEVIEPIVVTEEDEFEEGDRGFFSAVEKAEGVGGKVRPVTPRVLESRPIPDAAPAAQPAVAVAAPTAAPAQRPSKPRQAAAPRVRDASGALPPI